MIFVELTLYVFKDNDKDYILIRQYIIEGDEDIEEDVTEECYYYVI